MAINNYKPVDDQTGTPNGDFSQQGLPLGAAIPDRYINNIQYSLQNRLAKMGKNWDATATSEAGAVFSGEGSNLEGYPGNLGGGPVAAVPYTKGLQFSTHPALPLCIPFQMDISPGARQIIVRVACNVENAAGGMMAWAVDRNKEVYGVPPNIEDFNVESYAPTPNFFTAAARATNQYQAANLTSATGFNGMSYFEMTIDLNDRYNATGPALNTVAPPNNHKDFVFIAFQSGIGALSSISTIAGTAFTDPGIRIGNRVVRTTDSFQKYAGTQDPGALHEVVRFLPKSLSLTESYHHVVQTAPTNGAISYYDASQGENLVIYPALLPDRVGEGSADGSNAVAESGSGIEVGDVFERYPVTLFTIYSVSIEEVY